MEENGARNNNDSNTAFIRLGLRANINQFFTLVLVNAFVGAMIGLEQTVVLLIMKETRNTSAYSDFAEKS